MAYEDPSWDVDPLFEQLRRSMLGGWAPWGAPLLPGPSPGGHAGGMRAPMVDLVDEGDRFVLMAELPGVRKDDIRLSVRDNVIRLHAETERWNESSEPTDQAGRPGKGARSAGRAGGSAQQGGAASSSYLRRERAHVMFDRTIRLPDEVRAEDVRARFANGILTLTLPKANLEEAGGREIPIE